MLFLFRTFNINQDYILYGTNVPQESGAAETEAIYQVPVKKKVAMHDALLSVIVSELAALKASASGEHPEVIVKKIYKAAEDVAKLDEQD